jgi:uncharacterized membrane protein (UPF0127 family)
MGLFLFVCLSAIMSNTIEADAAAMKKDELVIVTASGQHKITIEIAETEQQKALGLMFRDTLGRRAGMLFPYRQPQELTMWMRNTYIPLDMVFIRKDGTVHRIEESTEPFSEAVIASKGDVVAVLELAGGVAREIGLKAGDKIQHRSFVATAR